MRKKLLALVLIFTMVMTTCLTGCGSSSASGDGSSEKKVLKVAIECTYPPYNWTQESETVANGDKAVKIKNADGYAYGYDVMYAQKVADKLGYDLEIYKIEWSSIFMGLQDQTYDIIMSGICYTAARDEIYDFSSAYYKRTIKAVVRSDSEYANYTKLSDFKGKNVKTTTQMGTNYLTYKDEVPDGVSVTDYETSTEAFMAVKNKAADVVILDLTTSKSALKSIDGLTMLDLSAENFYEVNGETNDCSMCFRDGDPLRDTVQGAIDSFNYTGDQMEKMMDEMAELQPASN